ncbi:hypothetical protein Tco_0747954 [Tanacetum coccineum]|uniref:Uncharacterized protein n=1 Tax=Tanacetum coccineum TaxID=301880 RepID=A0ABQ4YXM0_9ASTR
MFFATQLVPKFQGIGRCNNYAVLQSIPCLLECKIVGQILLDHPLSYALTVTADVPAVYLQQLWKIVSKVLNTKDTIRFKLDTQDIVYTVDMFRAILQLPMETPENPFVAPVPWRLSSPLCTRLVIKKKNVIQYPRFTKLIIANLMKKYPSIPQRHDEDYHSIKDDIPLVSVYTTGNVQVRGMLIPDEFLTESTPRAHRTPTLTVASPQGKKRKQSVGESSLPQKSLKITIRQKQVGEGEKDEQSYDDVDDSDNRLKLGSHKENPEHVDDDDDNE